MNITIFYFASFLISICLVIWYVSLREKSSNNLLIALICVAVSNGGYLALVLSKNLAEALLANKLTYIGGCFIPLTGFLVACELCNVKLPRKLEFFMYLGQIFLFFCTCSVGYCDIYYRTVQYHQKNGIAYLTKTYGPFHILYPVTLYLYLLSTLIVLIISFRRKHLVSYRAVWQLLLNYIIIALTYSLERILGYKVELMPFIYALSFFPISYIIRRSATYSLSNTLQKILENDKSYGYIEFDKNLHYMGCNVWAADIIPELKQMPLDTSIEYGDNLLYHKILPALQEYIINWMQPHIILKSNNRSYEIHISPLTRSHDLLKGYIVELKDATEHQKYLEMVESYNHNLESEVEGKTHKIREMQDKIIMGMAQMVESRDLNTGGHIKRTSSIVNVFSRRLLKKDIGFSPEFLYYVQKSAPMHDLGKIAVDDAILRKQGQFTPAEYEIMKKHSAAGAQIVSDILTGVESDDFVRISVNIAHYHHEKVDGTGYPQGLKGDEIPVEARIMALADVFDALVSKRCYKEAFSYDRAFSIIEDSLGTHFDEKLGRIFLDCRKELESLYNDFFLEESCLPHLRPHQKRDC